ncbi:MAG: CBS domain-containing protein [Variibacter sp.]
MTVKTILSGKGRDVMTISPTATLADAAHLLSARRIGAVVVEDRGRTVVGLLSERDIVRVVAAKGAEALSLPVEQAMTRKVVTCREADTVGVIMERMTTGKFRHLPVVEDGHLVGIVSIGDVVKFRLGEMEQESSALRDYILTA